MSSVTSAALSGSSVSGWASDRTQRRLTVLARLGGIAAVALVLLALFPHTAHAWTPGTHVFLGEAVLRSLTLLPDATADVLRAFPYDFLYGSIAADTSMAKKYVPTGRHCHSWAVGLEIHDAAPDEPMRAFALGYLAHLAADAIAHNHFVPKQLAVTASTSSLGHSYWESRFETHLGAACARRARDLILLDHSTPYRLDPSGDEALRRAKQVRREAMRSGGAERVQEEAEKHFGLPASSLGYVSKLKVPLYTASRSPNN